MGVTDTGSVKEDERGQQLAEAASGLHKPAGTRQDGDKGGSTGSGDPLNKLPTPATGGGGKAVAALGSAIGGAIRRNPKKGVSGLIGAVLLALIVSSVTSLLPEIKMSTFMENMAKKAFRHQTHATAVRTKLQLKYWIKQNLDPTFDANKAIVNWDRSMIKNMYGRLRGDGRMDNALRQAGYKIEYRRDHHDHPWVKITSPVGRVLTESDAKGNNFDEVFDLFSNDGRVKASAKLHQIMDEVYSGSKIGKRIASRRLHILTGIKLHWIDKQKAKVKVPIAELRAAIYNQALKFILEKLPVSRNAAIQLLSLALTGEKASNADLESMNDEIAKQIGDEAAKGPVGKEAQKKIITKVATESLTKMAGGASNPAGWILLALQAGCLLYDGNNKLLPLMIQIAKEKATMEYMVKFSEMNSALSQMHEGETDGQTVGVFMEQLVDKDGRDVAASNNYKRAGGEDVPFNATTDCTDHRELCDNKRPQTRITGKGGWSGAYLEWYNGLIENDVIKFIPGSPNSIYTGAICSVIDKVNDWLFKIFEVGFSLARKLHLVNEPVLNVVEDLAGKGGEWIGEKVLLPIVNHLAPAVVNADTRGPALANAVAAGGLGHASYFMRSFCGNPAVGEFNEEAAKECRLEGDELKKSETVIALEERENYQAAPLFERVASLHNPRSLANRFLTWLPSSPRMLSAKLAALPKLLFPSQLVTQLANVGGQFIAPAVAAPFTEEPTGVDIYGYTEAQLNDTPLGAGEEAKDQKGVKGMDKFDNNVVACGIIAGINRGKDMPEECNDEMDPSASQVTEGGAATGSGQDPNQNWGDAKDLAKKVLALWGSKITGNGGAKQDLETTASGGKVSNCSPATPLHPALLATMLKMAEKHTYFINNFNTGHGCDGANHPKGLAMDLNIIDGENTNGGPKMKAFAQEWFNTAPKGSGVGQKECLGNLSVPDGMRYFEDPCNHLHVDVGKLVTPKTW